MIRPRTAMVLAAGLGTRMRPLSDALPKPLLPLCGQSLLNHALDRLAASGVEFVVVNAFWRAERLEDHVRARASEGRGPDVVVRRETALLDTGGGVRAALELLGSDPVYVINGDAFWVDGPRPALDRLAARFAEDQADDVLLVHPASQVRAETGSGDFFLDGSGSVRRRGERAVAPYLYAGAHIMRSGPLETMPAEAFSMNQVWDRLIAADRLRGIVHDGMWFHLSSPADLAAAEALLRAPVTAATR